MREGSQAYLLALCWTPLACQFSAPAPVGHAPIPDAGFLEMPDGGVASNPDGALPPDASPFIIDASAPDAGGMTPDAGLVVPDGGLPVDAGQMSPDAGFVPDASLPALTCATLGGAAPSFTGALLASDVRALAPAGTSAMRPAYLTADGTKLYAAALQPDDMGLGENHFELWVFSRGSAGVPFSLSPLKTNLDVGNSNTSDELSLSYVSADDRYWFSQVEGTNARVRSTELRTAPEDFFPSWIDEWAGFPDGSAPQYSGAALSSDGRVLITTLDDSAQRDLREYERQTVLDPWTATGRTALLNDPSADELDPYLSPDGRLVVFASARQGAQLDLYYSCRDAVGDSWPAAERLGALSTPNLDERAPAGRLQGASFQLFFSRESTSGTWSEEVYLAQP